MTLKGEISASDLIIVDGAIEGDVSARVIQVGQGGVIRGNVSATEALAIPLVEAAIATFNKQSGASSAKVVLVLSVALTVILGAKLFGLY